MALSHVPTFKEVPVRFIRDIETSQVFYSRGGAHEFRWKCAAGDRLYWEIAVPNAHRPTVDLEVYSHGTAPADALTFSGTVDANLSHVFRIQACPFHSRYDAMTQIAYRSIARYGSHICTGDTPDQSVVVSLKPLR